MKKLLALLVCGVGLAATAGLSTQVDARPGVAAAEGPTDAQVEAALDAQARKTMGRLLEAQRNSGRMSTLPR
jgi:hypothetical protein